MSREWMTVRDAATRLGISEKSTRELIATSKIKATKAGREWRILNVEIDKYLGIEIDRQTLEKELYIKDLEKENAVLRNQVEYFKTTLKSLTNILNV